ncbi:MAG: glutathione S-transferase family protein [Pseudohongiellaceae bacterium]
MTDIKLVIGNKNYSCWSLSPWLLLKMYNVDFEEIQVALYQDNTAEKLGPYSPSLKVPVLLHHEVTIWDSLSICEFISEEFLGRMGWPASGRRRASARSVSAEIHSDFHHLKNEWPMNCAASLTLQPSDAVADEIARIDAIWSCCRRKFGESGAYLYGRFSIADCLFAPMAICFNAYGAKLSQEAQKYADALLGNPFVADWIAQGRAEKEPLSIVYASNM